MKMMKFFPVLVCTLWIGCSTLTDQELWQKIEQAKEHQNWDSTMTVSKRLLKEYPTGRYAGWARFALAESYRFKEQPREALENYKIFIEKYPDLPPHAVSLFLVGYLYGNNLGLHDSAKLYYEDFLKLYPEHDLVPSIKLELNSLGSSPHQMLNEQIEKNQSRTQQ